MSDRLAVSGGASECPVTPPELPRDPTPDRLKMSPSSPGRASPDSQCPICLGRLENKSFTDGCMHKFCFTCIQEWAKVRAVCPLCKQSFTSIIHNVRSALDYDRYRLPEPAPDESAHPAYVYRPEEALAPTRWMRRHQYRIRSLVAPMLWPIPEGHDYHLPAAPPSAAPRRLQMSTGRTRVTSRDRRQLYLDDMWARPSSDQLTGRYRETGPDFYRANPACTHRLVPWLNRELNATLNDPTYLAYVLETVMEMVMRVHILSSQFRARLQPSLNVWTDHFVHELYTFARSPYDMIGYDLNVQYERGRPLSPRSPVTLGDSSDEEAERRRDQWALRSTLATSGESTDSDIQVISPGRESTRPPVASPTPGPSGLQSALDQVRAFLESVSSLPRPESRRRTQQRRDVGADVRVDSDSSSNAEEAAGRRAVDSSDGDVQVVNVLPPKAERAPVVTIVSSSDSEGRSRSPKREETSPSVAGGSQRGGAGKSGCKRLPSRSRNGAAAKSRTSTSAGGGSKSRKRGGGAKTQTEPPQRRRGSARSRTRAEPGDVGDQQETSARCCQCNRPPASADNAVNGERQPMASSGRRRGRVGRGRGAGARVQRRISVPQSEDEEVDVDGQVFAASAEVVSVTTTGRKRRRYRQLSASSSSSSDPGVASAAAAQPKYRRVLMTGSSATSSSTDASAPNNQPVDPGRPSVSSTDSDMSVNNSASYTVRQRTLASCAVIPPPAAAETRRDNQPAPPVRSQRSRGPSLTRFTDTIPSLVVSATSSDTSSGDGGDDSDWTAPRTVRSRVVVPSVSVPAAPSSSSCFDWLCDSD